MTDDLRARLHAALTAPHALDALERLVDEVTADLRAENERLHGPFPCCEHCKDDEVHDVEPGKHEVSCQLCDDVLRRRAEAAEARVAALEATLANVRALAEDARSRDGITHGTNKAPGAVAAVAILRVLDADGADTTTTDGDIFDDGGRTYPAILPTIDGSGR